MSDKDVKLQKIKDETQVDWFLPAITCDGNVRDSLVAVIEPLDRKRDLVAAMRRNLCTADGNIDRLTVLGAQVKDLENTLRFRLGILQPERQASWFREAQGRDFGPFRSSMLVASVFANYAAQDVQKVKSALYDGWHTAKFDETVFTNLDPQRPCLWFVLLGFKQQLEAIAQLTGKFSELRLDQLPDGLPIDLQTRSLVAFLNRVRAEFQVIRDRLNICFEQLWAASERFWLVQEKLNAESKRRAADAESRARAQQGARKLSPRDQAEQEALRVMGFQVKPGHELLRKRYLELAKTLHPDRNGGNDEAFKVLNKAYTKLLAGFKHSA